MERRALFLVLNIDVYSALCKIVNAKCLVFLRSHMHDTGTELVSDIEVCTGFFDEQCKHGVITVLCNIVKCSKVLVCLQINPVAYLLLLFFCSFLFIRNGSFPDILKDYFEGISIIEVCAIGQQCKVERIAHYRQVVLLV